MLVFLNILGYIFIFSLVFNIYFIYVLFKIKTKEPELRWLKLSFTSTLLAASSIIGIIFYTSNPESDLQLNRILISINGFASCFGVISFTNFILSFLYKKKLKIYLQYALYLPLIPFTLNFGSKNIVEKVIYTSSGFYFKFTAPIGLYIGPYHLLLFLLFLIVSLKRYKNLSPFRQKILKKLLLFSWGPIVPAIFIDGMALQFGILKAPFILTPLSVLILFAGIFFTIAKYGIGKIWLDISTKELQLILEVLLLLIIFVINIIFVSAILKIILTLFLTVIFIIFNQQILLFFMRSFFRRDMQLLTSSKIFINEILTSPSLSDLFSKIVKFYYETLNPENVYLYHWNKKNELVLLIRKGDKEGKNLKFTRSFFEVFKKMNFSEVVEIKRVLYLSEEVRKIFNIFKETEARIIIPYYCGDEILYFLILSSKKNNAPYRKVEIEIMNKHTGFIITSIKNIFLFEELKNIRYIKKFNQVVTRISNELILSTKRLKILNRNNIFKVKNQIIHSIKKMKIMVGVIKGAIV